MPRAGLGSASDGPAQGLLPGFLWADQIPAAADRLGQGEPSPTRAYQATGSKAASKSLALALTLLALGRIIVGVLSPALHHG